MYNYELLKYVNDKFLHHILGFSKYIRLHVIHLPIYRHNAVYPFENYQLYQLFSFPHPAIMTPTTNYNTIFVFI